MATVAAVFTRAPWVRTPQQVVESLFRLSRPASSDAPAPPRPENKRVWASLLKGKNAVIQEVAEEMERRDPSAIQNPRGPDRRRACSPDSSRPEAERHPDPGSDARCWRNCGKPLMSSMPRAAWRPTSGSWTALCESCSAMWARSSRGSVKASPNAACPGPTQNAGGSRRLPLPKPRPHAL